MHLVRRFKARSTRGCNIQVNIFYLQQMHGPSGSYFWCMNARVSCAFMPLFLLFLHRSATQQKSAL